MKFNSAKYYVIVLLISVFIISCEAILGSKENDTTDEIFEIGRIDPNTVDTTAAYIPLIPFWEDFDRPTDVFVGYDEFVYVTDAEGVHLLDRADLSPRRTIELEGAVAVTQDRLFNVYVAARYDTVITAVDSTEIWNLPAVFKFRSLNGTDGPEPVFLDTLIHPFDDASRSSTTAKLSRLDKDSPNNDELVEITGLTTLADNTLYATRRGPLNNLTAIAAPDNIVLEFAPIVEGGLTTTKMRNVRQIRALDPVNPSLISSVFPGDISSIFVAPPQRNTFSTDRSFYITQVDQNTAIKFRALRIDVVETTDGLVFRPHTEFLDMDVSPSDGYIYAEDKFSYPSGVAVAGEGEYSGNVFVVDQQQHRLYQFQPGGLEGITVEGSNVIVSFGEFGNGPRQFDSPSGVAFFRDVLYVADTGNNRIARYKLSVDLNE